MVNGVTLCGASRMYIMDLNAESTWTPFNYDYKCGTP